MRVYKVVIQVSLLITCFFNSFGQAFQWSRELKPDKKAGWHRFSIPPEMKAKTKPGFTDLRILAFTKKGDTIEVPYFINHPENNLSPVEKTLTILNKATRDGQFFYTLEQPEPSLALQEIELLFEENNFDINVNLEGSMTQGEWFSILSGYRITALHNTRADFKFTTIAMPLNNYKYYRLSFAAPKNPQLLSASSKLNMIQDDSSRLWTYPGVKSKRETKNEGKETISTITLPEPLPVSMIQLHIHDTIQYIRSVVIRAIPFLNNLPQSREDPYITLANGNLNSFDKKPLTMPEVITEKLMVIIRNADNPTLQIDSITLKSIRQQVITLLPEAEHYYLVYGDKNTSAPDYDIGEVFPQIPEMETANITVGPESRNLPQKPPSWWEKEAWLYALIGLIIVMLGGFTLKMMRKRD